MMPLTPIAQLSCGHNMGQGIAKTALDQLATSVNSFGERAIRFLNEPSSEELLSFGPFCTRVLLENACAALVGRLDAFRLMYLSEFQSRPEYVLTKRARSAFSWTGDVIPPDGDLKDLWSTDHDLSKIQRSLFSKHYSHIYWKPGFESMLDVISKKSPHPELAEVISLDADRFINEGRGNIIQLYSTLSKGVHWEFFTNALVFDENTIKSCIRDVCLQIGLLGLTSHFIPTAYASLNHDQAIEQYIELRKQVG